MTATVDFRNVSKRFELRARHDSIRDMLAAGVARLVGHRKRSASKGTCTNANLQGRASSPNDQSRFWALRDVDFRVERGEALGIIGPNGAGKSTALKLLAGILRPDSGTITVRGRLAALIEVGAGFHGDLTGRENVYLNGAILGMSRNEIRCKLDAIAEFAGIGRFLDEPVKHYSSGMYARLGFSIAAHVDPDVLLVDEVLSVGDAVFRLRCMEHMRTLLRRGTTLILVTHQLEQMQAVCTRSIVLEEGRTTFDGISSQAVDHYLSAVSRSFSARSTNDHRDRREAGLLVECPTLRVLDDRGKETIRIAVGRPLRVELGLRLSGSVRNLVVEFNLKSSPEESLLSFNSARANRLFKLCAGEHRVTLELPGIPLAGGQYFWSVRLWDAENGATPLDTFICLPLSVNDGGRATGRMVIEHEWRHEGPTVMSREHTVGELVPPCAMTHAM